MGWGAGSSVEAKQSELGLTFHVPLAPQALGRLDLDRPLLVREARVSVEGAGLVGPRLEAVVRVADFFGHMALARAERGAELRLRGEGGHLVETRVEQSLDGRSVLRSTRASSL